MRITPYQANVKMLWESQRITHRKNIEQLENLNKQADQQQKVQEIKTHWVKVTKVDVMA
jgi:hypothetical protein